MLARASEHFAAPTPNGLIKVVSAVPPRLYRQERDWTCSVACLRSITSKWVNIGSEDEVVTKYHMEHGPHYAHDLIECGALNGFDYVTSSINPNPDEELNRLHSLLDEGATIMVETCRSFDHWLVLLAYFPNECEYAEDQHVLFWDPYYGETLLMRASEFCDEWISGEWATNNIICDFIAIKGINKREDL